MTEERRTTPAAIPVWLTYAWQDNDDGDVDFVAQQLRRSGLNVQLDRWNLIPGRQLWEQIAAFIQEPTRSSAWLVYMTENSLASPAVREEYFMALDRALHARDETYPIIAIVQGTSIARSSLPGYERGFGSV